MIKTLQEINTLVYAFTEAEMFAKSIGCMYERSLNRIERAGIFPTMHEC